MIFVAQAILDARVGGVFAGRELLVRLLGCLEVKCCRTYGNPQTEVCATGGAVRLLVAQTLVCGGSLVLG